ncbi:hypothetical protein ACFZBU_16930 [Embleya sp. NPDC008237]|uniref:hypothetical protein n=1 Tax=Embleya sp. NPDC008237 TaxID=3363978 RepID=UPI0036EA82C1
MTEQRNRSVTIPEEFGGLIGEFRDLLAKYPEASRHFSLAYHPADEGEESGSGTATTASISQPVFECSRIEPGFVVCRRVHDQ